MRIAAGLATCVVMVGCGQGTAEVRSPTPSPFQASPSPSLSPSLPPQPPQQAEPSLPAPVEETGAATAEGNLYVIGGFNAAGASLSSVYVFDGTGWREGPSLPLPVDHPSAASLGGYVYLAGGHSNGRDSARLFRLDGEEWTELAPMHFARGGQALVALGGRLYALGGNTSRGNVAAVEAYDPIANTWTVVASLPSPRNHVSGFAAGGTICVAGGRSPTTARVDCLDPGSLAWSRLPDLPQPTSGGGSLALDDGDVVVLGGEDAGESRVIDQFVVYQPGGAWKTTGSMLSARHGFELVMFNGRGWACGGGSAPGLHPVATCTSVGDPASSNG
jgi:Kelch motif